jgi:hypothetical protein
MAETKNPARADPTARRLEARRRQGRAGIYPSAFADAWSQRSWPAAFLNPDVASKKAALAFDCGAASLRMRWDEERVVQPHCTKSVPKVGLPAAGRPKRTPEARGDVNELPP